MGIYYRHFQSIGINERNLAIMCFGFRKPYFIYRTRIHKIKRRNIRQTIFLLLILVIINLSEAIVKQMFVILSLKSK